MNEVISGTTGATDTRTTRTWPAAVAVAVVGAIVCWFRVPSVGRYTMYAEDGQIFVQQWLTGHGFPLFEPYAGYQHFLPRISTWLVVHLVPVSGWGIGVTVAACLLAGGTAALVYVFSRDVIDTQVSRLGLAAVTVLIPLAGQEPVGNLANLHWYLLFLTPWLLLATPRSTAGTVAMCLVALASTLTESQAVIFAPIAIWRLVSSAPARPVMVCWFVGVGGQLLTFLLAPRVLSGGGWPPPMSVIKGYLGNVSLTIDTGTARRAGAVIVGLGVVGGGRVPARVPGRGAGRRAVRQPDGAGCGDHAAGRIGGDLDPGLRSEQRVDLLLQPDDAASARDPPVDQVGNDRLDDAGRDGAIGSRGAGAAPAVKGASGRHCRGGALGRSHGDRFREPDQPAGRSSVGGPGRHGQEQLCGVREAGSADHPP